MQLTESEKLARTKVCLPLDNLESLSDLEARVKELSPVVGLFKIGKESYTRFGPQAVKAVQEYGADVFLDLKYHDIPNTVQGAASAATELGIYMFNVHTFGGKKMMESAVQGAKDGAYKYKKHNPWIVGVTILTSIDDNVLNNELKVPGTVNEKVSDLAYLACESGLDGIVCSATDLDHFDYTRLRRGFMYITPGIAGPNTPAGSDQKRVLTPRKALEAGATILVVGRAITSHKTSEERLQAGYEILKDMAPYFNL